MEESAPKRRRITPSPPRPSGAAPGDSAPQSPGTGPQQPRAKPKRPSWASPTKASMARYNPQILERRMSASPPKSPSPARRPPHRGASVAASEQSMSEVLAPRPPRSAEDVLASVPDSARDESIREEEDEGGEEEGEGGGSRPGSRRASARGAMAGAPIRSPARPSPRPLPPPAPEGEDDFNPFAGRVLRRSPETGIRIPPPPEPELPPSVDDPVSSTPPRGIHSSSSPSRRRVKSKPLTGSPLKQPPARPGDDENEGIQPRKKLFGSRGSAPPSRLRRGAVLAETTNNVRGIPAFDANADKRKERDALREQLAKLRRDLDATTRQNERIRAMQKSGRKVALADEDEIMNIVRRQLLPQDFDSQPTQTQMLAKAALDPMAIVPFGKPAASVAPAEPVDDDVSDIKSHHPIPMTAEEELPFLQLFSPFHATSNLAVLPRTGDEPLRQLFTIYLRSRLSPGLFSAKLEVTVDALKLRILSLNIAALEPAARPELGAFLDRICRGECNRSMQRNVGIITWAMAEWLRVAEQRGRFWARFHEETASKELLLDMSRSARTRRAKRGKNGQEKEVNVPATGPMRSQDLLRFMGQQSFDLQVPPAQGSSTPSSLRLTWKIEFDWTGEAQSKVAVMIGIPGKWHQADRKGALGKLPSLFQTLVEGGEEPDVAVRKVVALLAGEE